MPKSNFYLNFFAFHGFKVKAHLKDCCLAKPRPRSVLRPHLFPYYVLRACPSQIDRQVSRIKGIFNIDPVTLTL